MKYKIIISKEEPKCFDCQGTIKDGICFCNREEPKQETVEEAAVINYKKLYEGEPLTQDVPIDAFIEGAKWMQEKMYSEEDMRKMYDISCGNIGLANLDDQTENNERFISFLNKIKK